MRFYFFFQINHYNWLLLLVFFFFFASMEKYGFATVQLILAIVHSLNARELYSGDLS